MVTEEMVRRRLVPLAQEGVLLLSEIQVAPSSLGRDAVRVQIRRTATSRLPVEKIDQLVRKAVSDLDVVMIVDIADLPLEIPRKGWTVPTRLRGARQAPR